MTSVFTACCHCPVTVTGTCCQAVKILLHHNKLFYLVIAGLVLSSFVLLKKFQQALGIMENFIALTGGSARDQGNVLEELLLWRSTEPSGEI